MTNHQQTRDLNPVSIIGRHMTRDGKVALTIDQLNGKGVLQRAMSVGAIDKEKRTVELAFSSEYAEGERWFGIEILDHAPGAVDLSRLQDAGAVLMNHDWNDQVAVVESVEIGSDRKGRAVVRFSESERGEEIFRDVAGGIRKHVSVGYRVLDAKLQETRDSVDVYRITRWQPYEISFVPVPFDPTVGVGRSAEIPQEDKPAQKAENSNHPATRTISTPKGNQPMKTKTLRNAAGHLVRAEVDENDNIVREIEVLEQAGDDVRSHLQRGSQTEQIRVRTLMEMGDKFTRAVPKAAELARTAIQNGDSPEKFQAALLEAVNTRAARPLDEQGEDAAIGMSDKEVRNFSFLRAVRAMAPNASRKDREDAAFEFECSDAAQRAYGKAAKGILIPNEVLSRAFNAGGAANSPSGAQSGANLVANSLMSGSFIEMLRNRTTIMRLATTMGGLVGNMDIPKQTGGATGYWVGEGDDATEGSPTVGQISFSPKTVAAYTDLTRRLMMQSTPDAEGIVRRDLNNALAQALDYAGYYGSGSANQPRGLKNYTGINGVDFATQAKPTFAELVAMETAVAADNADIGQMGYVGNTGFRGWAKTTPKFGAGTEATIWEQGGTVNGYRTEITNQVSADDLFFGNFADFIIAMWGGLDLVVDAATLSKSGGLRLVVFQDVDMNLRRVESVCWGSHNVS